MNYGTPVSTGNSTADVIIAICFLIITIVMIIIFIWLLYQAGKACKAFAERYRG